jgi:hypothetical protein
VLLNSSRNKGKKIGYKSIKTLSLFCFRSIIFSSPFKYKLRPLNISLCIRVEIIVATLIAPKVISSGYLY